MITQRIQVATQKNIFTQKVRCVQGDSGRQLECTVVDCPLQSDYTARIFAQKPSGAKIYNVCDISTNKVVVDLTTQMLAEIGNVPCQVELMDGDLRLTSFEFMLEVVKSLVDNAAVESTNEFSVMEQAIDAADQAVEDAQEAVETAEGIVGEAKVELKEYVDEELAKVYRPRGSYAFEDLPALEDAQVGSVYDISTDFVTTDDFREGAGKEIPAGTNIAVVETDDGNKYDVMAGMVDLTPVTNPTFTEATELENVNSVESQSVLWGKMKKWYTDAISKVAGLVTKVGTATLTTTSQDLSGAVNELNSNLISVSDNISPSTSNIVSVSGNISRYGKIVLLSVRLNMDNVATTQGTTLFAIPEEYRPPSLIPIVLNEYGTNLFGRVLSSGLVQNENTLAAGTQVIINSAWTVS